MKKVLSISLILITIFLCLVGCDAGDKYAQEQFYGVVKFLEESNQMVVYIPKLGDVVIPATDGICSCFDGHDPSNARTYKLKEGDLVKINFKYEKSWDDNSVKILETYPAQFDRKAELIEVLKEDISFGKTDAGYEISFPSTIETEDAKIGDTLYFIQCGGVNGRDYKKLYATGEITAKSYGIITVALTIPEGEAEFLDHYNEMTVESTWEK